MNITKASLLRLAKLLYLEAYLQNNLGNSVDTVKEAIGKAKREDMSEDLGLLLDVLEEMFIHDYDTPMNVDIYRMGLAPILNNKHNNELDRFFEVESIDAGGEEIVALRGIIKRQAKIEKLKKTFQSAFFNMEKVDEIPDMNKFLTGIIETVEKNNPNESGDKAVVDRVNINNSEELESIMSKSIESNKECGVWKTFLTGLNKMTQGGFKNGAIVFFNALQHKFKSGMTLSVFSTLPLLNTPSVDDGKDTLVWLSFEDPLTKVIPDVYSILKVFNNPKHPRINIEDIDPKEASAYVSKVYKERGFNVEFMRIDPSDFSFRALFELLTKMELEGCRLRVVGLDYLSQIPKTGCSTTGAMGADTRELVRRIRNWMAARDILCISPHQLSAGAKELLRLDLPDVELVPKVVNNGYTADSSQIDQELDLEIAQHIVMYNKEAYLHVGRGKDKLSRPIEDKKDLFFFVKFPSNGNFISSDLETEPNCYNELSDFPEEGASELDEIFA